MKQVQAMKTRRDCIRLCVVLLYLFVTATLFSSCEARSSRHFKASKLHRMEVETSSIRNSKKLKPLRHNLNEHLITQPNAYSPFSLPPLGEPTWAPSPFSSPPLGEPVGSLSPLSLPPLGGPLGDLSPFDLPNTPTFSVHPLLTLQPPSSNPTSITDSTPPPPFSYDTPILPYQSPPPPSLTPSPPGTSPASPGYGPVIPSPPEYVPSPPGYVPNPREQVPSAPSTVPNPPGSGPRTSSYEPGTSGYGPNQPGLLPNAPGFGPSLPNYFPSPLEFVPSPPLFQPPVIFPPPSVPPPPYKGPENRLWCVAKSSVPDPIIQEAMDYACGSGADCESIQPNGSCYQPDTVLAHASYAFNSYWQSTKVAGGTCDFGGTAILIETDPSLEGCRFIIY